MRLKYTGPLIYFLLPLLMLHGTQAIDFEPLSDEQALSEIDDEISSLPAEGRLIMAKKIYESKRLELNLKALQLLTLPMERVIMEAPPSDFRSRLAIRILKSDDFWSLPLVAGSSAVGSQYQRSLMICDAIVSPYYREGEVDWTGPLTKERRALIANSFGQLVADESTGSGSPSSRQEDRNLEVIPTPEVRRKDPTTTQPSDEMKLERDSSRLHSTLVAFGVALMALALSILIYRRRSRRRSAS